jgi:type IV pilus assembly protein PilA
MQKLYEAVLGKKNSAYYLSKFQQFDQQPSGIKASWNWSAFLFSGYWLLYRKMYGWFFASLGSGIIIGIIFSVPLGILIIIGIIFPIIFSVPSMIFFGVFGNSLYHDGIKKKITTAQQRFENEPQIFEFLCSKGGVNTWVPWFFVYDFFVSPDLAIPAYQDYITRAIVTEGLALAVSAQIAVDENAANGAAFTHGWVAPNATINVATVPVPQTNDLATNTNSGISINPTNGIITISYTNKISTSPSLSTIVLLPVTGSALPISGTPTTSGSINWECHSATAPANDKLTTILGTLNPK